MEESAWSSKCRTFKVSGSFLKGRLRKTRTKETVQPMQAWKTNTVMMMITLSTANMNSGFSVSNLC